MKLLINAMSTLIKWVKEGLDPSLEPMQHEKEHQEELDEFEQHLREIAFDGFTNTQRAMVNSWSGMKELGMQV